MTCRGLDFIRVPWQRERNEQIAGQVTQETAQQFCGVDYVPQMLEACYKKKKVRPGLTSSLEQALRLRQHGLERRCNP